MELFLNQTKLRESLILICYFTFLSIGAKAQWTTSGSTINYGVGNVGIGNTSPLHKLTVNGQVTAINGQLGFTHYNNDAYDNFLATYYNNSTFMLMAGQNNGVNPSLSLNTGGFQRLTIIPSGNIGIGTTSPGNLLTISTSLTTAQAKGISLRANEAFYADFAMTGPDYNAYGVGGNQIWLSSQLADLNIGPSSSHHIKFVNNGVERMRIASNGNVGIGTTNPVALLTLSTSLVSGQSNGIHLRANESIFADFIATGPAYNSYGVGANQFWLNSQAADLNIGPATAHSIKFVNNGVERMRLSPNGFLGIGTTTPTAKLSVAGDFGVAHTATVDYAFASYVSVNRDLTKAFAVLDKNGATVFNIWGNGIVNSKKIYAEAFEVRPDAMTLAWYDFVFANDYKLMGLKELEIYIASHKHLPDIPSENEVKSNGFNLAEMDGLLLKKIEELTLYVIQQQKEIDRLKVLIDEKN